MPVNTRDLMKKATSIAKVTEGNTSGSTLKMSLSVVYNKNGKRLTLSKKLVDTLMLTDTAQISFIIEDGVVLLGKNLSANEDERIVLILKDEMDTIKGVPTGKKQAYSADAAYIIATSYGLDYTKYSSKSFGSISIDDTDPTSPVAVIIIK